MITVGSRVRVCGNAEAAAPQAGNLADADFLQWLRGFEGVTGIVKSISESGLVAEVQLDKQVAAYNLIGWRIEDLTTDLVPALDDRSAVEDWLDS